MSAPAQPLAQHLKRLHDSLPPDNSVLFGDLSTCTVLRAVGGAGSGQEVHDAALALAVECFCEPAEDALSVCGSDGEAPIPMRALRIESGRVFVAHRGGAEGLDAVMATLPVAPQSKGNAGAEQLPETLDRINAACASLLSADD